MNKNNSSIFAIGSAILIPVAIGMVFFYAPLEKTMGSVQKIFYFHVPLAMMAFLSFFVAFIAGIMYLRRKEPIWDARLAASVEIGVVLTTLVLITGSLWGKPIWNTYWTWDPRLTTSLLSFLLYVAYLALRAFAGRGDAERRFAAALGVLGAANLPIIHLSVRKWGGQHPQVVTGSGGGLQHPDMKLALGLGFATFTFLAVVALAVRIRHHLA